MSIPIFIFRGDFLNKINVDKCIKDKSDLDSIRPKTFGNYIGQEKIKEIVSVYIEAAKKRNEPLDHMLFYGPPGLGKTTIANIIANEMSKKIRIVTGPNIEKPGDIVAILNSIEDGDIVFIDEIHRINRVVEEILYPAMEDFSVDIKMGEGVNSKTIRVPLPKFTLIGATTRVGLLSAPLRDRFGLINKMQYYTEDELSTIVLNSAKILNTEITLDAACEIAKRARGTPRLANRLLKQIRNFAQVKYENEITKEIVDDVLNILGVDNCGLDENDIKYLKTIHNIGKGNPVGLTTLASSIGEDTGTIEDVYEPYLLQLGFINKTSRGRILTDVALAHIYNPKV